MDAETLAFPDARASPKPPGMATSVDAVAAALLSPCLPIPALVAVNVSFLLGSRPGLTLNLILPCELVNAATLASEDVLLVEPITDPMPLLFG